MAKNRKLLAEGKDDCIVVANLCEAHQIPEVFDIIDKEGISKLLESLHVDLKASDLEVLGILVDADVNLQDRWQSLSTILSNEGYSVPAQPTPAGTILREEDKPTVGIWLMPDNRLPGMLEDFVAALVPDNDVLLPYARTCVEQLPEKPTRFPQVQRAKADIHTWLAWQEEPGKPFGIAITAHYLDAQSVHAEGFINWLRMLFIL
jgi:hypothetical protein